VFPVLRWPLHARLPVLPHFEFRGFAANSIQRSVASDASQGSHFR